MAELGGIEGDDCLFIVSDDAGEIFMGLNHLLMMAAALHGGTSADVTRHEAEHLALPPVLLPQQLLGVVFDKFNVFLSFREIPHALLVVVPAVALPHVLELLAVHEEEGSAGTG